MDISFGWTWPALYAPEPLTKLVTRRLWKPSHAAKFKPGMICTALDKVRFAHGKPIGKIRILKTPYIEPINEMPFSDYFKEGFAFLNLHRELLPDSMPIGVDVQGFKDWKESGIEPYVVRFEILELDPKPFIEINKGYFVCIGCGSTNREATIGCDSINREATEGVPFLKHWIAVDYKKQIGVCPSCPDKLQELKSYYDIKTVKEN